MTNIKQKNLFLFIFAIWFIIWVNFFIRDLTKGKYLKEYKILLSRDSIGKASYTYGDRLFEFLRFCNSALPDGASYDLVGTEDLSLDYRHVIYYLYPHLNHTGAEYILVFDKPGYMQSGYVPFKELDTSRFILKRT